MSNGCLADYDRVTDSWGMSADGSWFDPGFPQKPDHPVVCTGWNDAVAMTRWLSKETGEEYYLPSEKEWEYAARASTSSARYWGLGREGSCRYANVGDELAAKHYGWPVESERSFDCSDGYVHTAPVGSFLPNALGLYDMIGNAWEWVADCFESAPTKANRDGTGTPEMKCERRVERGGGWSGRPRLARAASCGATPPFMKSRHLGFRVARKVR